jgi:hypothetical protein
MYENNIMLLANKKEVWLLEDDHILRALLS